MFKKVSNMSKEDCLREVLLWSNLISITWFLCLFSFIGLSLLALLTNSFKDPIVLLIILLPMVLFFGLLYPLDKINNIMRKEGLVNEPRRTTTSKK